MVTLYKASNDEQHEAQAPYAKKEELDTRIPPKAKPIFDNISVNGVAIAESDILHEAQNHPSENPGEALLSAARALIVRELLWQEAKKQNLVEDNSDVSDKTSNLEQSNEVQSTPLDKAINALMEREIHVANATQEECKRFYDNNAELFYSEPLWEVRHILLLANPNDKEAVKLAKLQADTILLNLQKQPERFEAYASAHSACPSSKQGGSLGQISKGSTVPEFEKALHQANKKGLLTAPVETRYGFHIVEIMNIIEGEKRPFEHVHQKIAAWLEASSWSKSVAQYITILASKADIQGIEFTPVDGALVQ